MSYKQTIRPKGRTNIVFGRVWVTESKTYQIALIRIETYEDTLSGYFDRTHAHESDYHIESDL